MVSLFSFGGSDLKTQTIVANYLFIVTWQGANILLILKFFNILEHSGYCDSILHKVL